jgi:choline dehydrogenase-like flavoprotein
MPLTYASQLARAGIWGEPLRKKLREYNHVAGINMHGECFPSETNFLELSDERDQLGLPKPRIFFTDGENEKKMSHHGQQIMTDIWNQAGAKDIRAYNRKAHTMGTCRMGTSADSAVVDPQGRSFDVPNLYISDNSTFPSSLSANPALTIMALSLRTADQFLSKIKN